MNNKGRIMVIDDEDDLRESVEYQFAARGYDVVTAVDGLDGLNKLSEAKPNLIILDLNMPNMGGIEFYQKICNEQGLPKYPVLILTARANTQQLFKEFNIHGFIPKPFEIDQVIKEAEIILQKENRKNFLPTTGSLSYKTESLMLLENHEEDFNRISNTLLKAGYKLSAVLTATDAIERMMQDPPTVALVKLNLKDIPGDLLVQKLIRMPKTERIKFIVYVNYRDQHDAAIVAKLADKTGVVSFVQYGLVEELLVAVDEQFKSLKGVSL